MDHARERTVTRFPLSRSGARRAPFPARSATMNLRPAVLAALLLPAAVLAANAPAPTKPIAVPADQKINPSEKHTINKAQRAACEANVHKQGLTGAKAKAALSACAKN
jgi:hypothetical protein